MSVLKMSEAELQAAIIDLAHLLGWRVHHSRPARMKDGSWRTPIAGDAGFPDLCMARDGVAIWAECKSETGKLSHDQDSWHHELKFAGPLFVWRPSDWLSGRIEQILRGERTR